MDRGADLGEQGAGVVGPGVSLLAVGDVGGDGIDADGTRRGRRLGLRSFPTWIYASCRLTASALRRWR